MRAIPKHKKGGIVSNTVLGAGALIIATIITLVIVQSIGGGNVVTQYDTITVQGESGAWLNTTVYTVANSEDRGFATLTITGANNYTGATPLVVLLDNFTVSGATITNSSALTYANLTLNYTYQRNSDEYSAEVDMRSNFTGGIDNISGKLPTILLVVAIVFLLSALALLMRQSNAVGIGGGGSL